MSGFVVVVVCGSELDDKHLLFLFFIKNYYSLMKEFNL